LIRAASAKATPDYLLHPALLDGALQGLVALLADQVDANAGVTCCPGASGRVRLFELDGRMPASARLRVGVVGTRSASADIELFDAKDRLLARVSGLLVPPRAA